MACWVRRDACFGYFWEGRCVLNPFVSFLWRGIGSLDFRVVLLSWWFVDFSNSFAFALLSLVCSPWSRIGTWKWVCV